MSPFPYLTYRPRDCSAGMIVGFHGYLQSAAGFRRKSGLDGVGDAAKCMVVYPQGRLRNWGGISAKKPKSIDVGRLSETLRAIHERYENAQSIHLAGFSDGASFALYAGAHLAGVWPIASVTAYSGLYHGVPSAPSRLADPYSIWLLHNVGEKLIRNVHQKEIQAQYEDRGHVVTRVNFPRRRKRGRHHYWRPEANRHVLKHIVEAMRKTTIPTGGVA